MFIKESVAVEWLPATGLVKLEYGPTDIVDRKADFLAFGMITPVENAVIFRVDSTEANDYMEMEIVRKAFKYNLIINYQG